MPTERSENVERPGSEESRPIVIQQSGNTARAWLTRLLLGVLLISLFSNFAMYSSYQDYFAKAQPPREKYYSGEKDADAKIALIQVDGTIMPPYTKRILRSIQRIREDDAVKGAVLVVDSPGGLVADSHRIYHALKGLRNEKPVVVSMKRLAASGGYYVAMGAGTEGTIYAEPTTWTGSIGVIIPHFDATQLSKKIGIDSKPLKTGKYKDALSPFREMTEDERAVWEQILDDAFDQFLSVITENRSELDRQAVEGLATGQIYTAEQAVANGLVDKIGFEEDAVEALKGRLNLEKARVIEYQYQPGLLELMNQSVRSSDPEARWRTVLEAAVPRAMYYYSSLPGLTR